MTEAKVSSKTPATTAKKSKGDKERDVIGRIKDVLPQWEIQKVEAFCAEHGHDLDRIHRALDGSFERTGQQPDDWQIMTKKEQKPKRGGRTEGSREPRESPRVPREDRPRGERSERSERGERSDRGRGRGGGDSRGRGRGGADRGRGGRGGARSTAGDITSTTEPVPEAWGNSETTPQIDTKPETTTTVEWGASPVAAAPVVAAAASRAAEPVEKKMTWAEKAANARKAKVVSELQSADAFPPQQTQQNLGPTIVHVQPQVQQPQAGTSYRAALQGNSRWGRKTEPVVEPVADTSMVAIEQQTNSLAIDSFQPADSYAQAVDTAPQNLSSDVLNSIPVVQETVVTSSFPQAEVFQPEPTFQSQPQNDSFQIYQPPQPQSSSVQNTVSDPKVIQSTVFVQSVTTPTDFSSISDLRAPHGHGFSPDNGGKLVIDLLSAANSVILPLTTSEPLSYGIEFGSFGQPAQSTNFAPVQAEPVQQPELKPVVQQPIEPTPEPQQLSQPSFASNLRDDTLPVKQASAENSASQFSQNQFYQNQPQTTPSQAQTQPTGYRGGPPSGSYDPHYGYAFPYENQSPYYSEFASRDSQPQSFHYTDQYPNAFRGGSAVPTSGGNRRPASNTNQPYYPSPTGRGGLLNGSSDGSTGSASPPTSEPVSPNAAKSGSFSSKPANFATNKPPFNNTTTKIPPQIPPYTAKPAGVPASNYNKQPPATSQPTPKSFKPPAQPQSSQSQHHPDPQQHYMPYPPGVYAGYPYPYPYQPPVMHPQMPYAPYDPRYGYPYPGPVQSFEGDYDYPKPPSHYSEGGSTPRGNNEWNGNADSQKSSNNAPVPSTNAPSTNTLPTSMNSTKSTVAPGGANKKPTRFEYAEQDPHFNSYGFSGAPASSPMAMHAAAAPYQPTNYGQPIMHPMGGQAPYGNAQYESHPPRGYAGQTWQ